MKYHSHRKFFDSIVAMFNNACLLKCVRERKLMNNSLLLKV